MTEELGGQLAEKEHVTSHTSHKDVHLMSKLPAPKWKVNEEPGAGIRKVVTTVHKFREVVLYQHFIGSGRSNVRGWCWLWLQ